jgi:hypothetical protein
MLRVVRDLLGFLFAARLQTLSPAGFGVMDVIDSTAPIEPVSLLSHIRLSSFAALGDVSRIPLMGSGRIKGD